MGLIRLHMNPAFAGPPGGVFRACRKRSERPSCLRVPAMLLVILAGVAFDARGQTATDPADGTQTLSQWHGRWYTASPRALGFDPVGLSDAITSLGEMPGVYGFLLVRDGYLVSERYWREGTRSKPHNIKSASKSVISALVGIAIDKGYFGLDQPIVELLPKAAKFFDDPQKKKITVRHLLTMRSGLRPASYQAYNVWIASGDWVKEALHGPLRSAPGASYHYSTANTHLLSVILAETTNGSTRSFAEKHLFGPMDIEVHGWEKDPKGVHIGGNNLSLVPRDLAKFGQLYLDGGRWGDRQLIPRSWIEASTRPTENGSHDIYGTYAYLWWAQPPEKDSFAAVGFGGQYVLVSPRHNAVVVLTSTLESKGKRWAAKLFGLLQNGVLRSLVDPSMPPTVLAATITATVNLRARPSQSGRRLALIPEGRQVELLKHQGDWVLGRIDGKQGWLHGDFVDRLALVWERRTVALVTQSSEPEGTPDPNVRAPDTSSGGGEQTAPARSAVRPSSVAVDSELLALRAQLDRLGDEIADLNDLLGERPALPRYRITRRLSFRRGPSKNAKRIGVLDQATEFQALDRSGPWLKARLNGAEGWLHSDYAKAIEASSRVSSQTDLTTSLSALAESIRRLDDAEKQRSRELEASRSRVAKLQGALGDAEASKLALAAELETLRAESRAQRTRFSETEKQRAKALAASRDQIASLESRVEQVAASRKEIDKALEANRGQVARLESTLGEAQASRRALATVLAELREENQTQRESLDEAEKQRAQALEASRSRLSELQGVLQREQSSRQVLAAELAELRTENEAQRASFGEAEKQRVQALEASRSRLFELEGALGEERSSRQALTAEFEALREDNQAQRASFGEAEKQRVQALEASRLQVAKLQVALGEERTSRQALTAEFEVLRKDNQAKRTRLGSIERRRAEALETSRSQIVKLEKTLEQERLARQTLVAELEGVRVENRAQAGRLGEIETQSAQARETGRSQIIKLEKTLEQERIARQSLVAELERVRVENRARAARFADIETQSAQALEASQAQVANLRNTLQQEHDARKTFVDELAGLRDENRAHRAKLDDIERQSAEALEASRSQVTGLESTLQQEQAARRSLTAELEALRDENWAQAARFGDSEKQWLLQTDASRARIAELERTLHQHGESRQTLKGQLDGLRKEIQAQSARLGEVDEQRAGQLEAARSEMATLQGKLDQEQASKGTLFAELERLHKEFQSQRAQLDDAEKRRARELRASRLQIDALEHRVRQERVAKEALVADLDPLRRKPAVRQQELIRIAQAGTRVEQHEKQPAGQAVERSVSGVEPGIARSSPLPEVGTAGHTEPVAFFWAPRVETFVRAWADAWSRQAVDDYLAHYSEDFQPADGSSRAAWGALRRQRLTQPSFVEVKVSDMEIESLDVNRVRATFRQAYRADHYRDVVVKVLELARHGGRWWIVRELAR